MTISEKKLAAYEKLVATVPDLERKGATMPYTSKNGHMFSFLTKDGTLALRLAEPAREDFLQRYDAQLVEQHGTVMKEYVAVPESLWKNARALRKLFAASHDYVGGLPPKATKRPKKKTAKKKTAKKKTARFRAESGRRGGAR